MATILFDEIIFGPIKSRRLGISLGINLLPTDGKLCSFNCIYCECGLNEERHTASKLPTRKEVKSALKNKLRSMKTEGIVPDVMTYAGNGEPTLHPEFAGIVEDTIFLRDMYFSEARIVVLSNSTTLHKENIFQTLKKVDDNIMKLDSVLDIRIRQINVPNSSSFNFDRLLTNLVRFEGNIIIQTMFLKGIYKGQNIDNTMEEEITGWIEALKKINPRKIMIYTIDRETPVKGLKKVLPEELEKIADKVRAEGFNVQVSG